MLFIHTSLASQENCTNNVEGVCVEPEWFGDALIHRKVVIRDLQEAMIEDGMKEHIFQRELPLDLARLKIKASDHISLKFKSRLGKGITMKTKYVEKSFAERFGLVKLGTPVPWSVDKKAKGKYVVQCKYAECDDTQRRPRVGEKEPPYKAETDEISWRCYKVCQPKNALFLPRCCPDAEHTKNTIPRDILFACDDLRRGKTYDEAVTYCDVVTKSTMCPNKRDLLDNHMTNLGPMCVDNGRTVDSTEENLGVWTTEDCYLGPQPTTTTTTAPPPTTPEPPPIGPFWTYICKSWDEECKQLDEIKCERRCEPDVAYFSPVCIKKR